MTWVFAAANTLEVEEQRTFDQDKMDQYRSDPEFSYLHESQLPQWWAGFYEWLANLLGDLFAGADADAVVVGTFLFYAGRIIMWGLLAFAVGMLVYSLYKYGVFGVIQRKKPPVGLSFSELENRVLETDWEQLIEEATSKRQYEVAIRLLFLHLLQSLNSKGWIEWNKSKTIRDYQTEIPTEHRTGFALLARYYQYSWFGEIGIEESKFNDIRNEFTVFNLTPNVD